MVAYQNVTEGGDRLSLQYLTDDASAVAIDNEGNKWNLFGEAVSGASTGEKFKFTRSYFGFYFSWAAFYPALEIF